MWNRLMVIAVLCCAVQAVAEPRWGLKWRSAAGCIEAADLSRAVEAKLGRPVFGADPDFRIDGVADGSESAWKVRLTLVNRAGEILGNRELSSAEKACTALDGKVTAVIALMVESGPPEQPEAPKVTEPVKAAPAPAPLPVPNPVRRRSSDGVYVEIDSDDPRVQLLRHDGMATGSYSGGTVVFNSFSMECTAPCGSIIKRPDSQFYLTGDGITPSAAFSLGEYKSGVKLKVKTGRGWMRGLGWISMATGLALALAGGTLFLLDGVSTSTNGVKMGVENPYVTAKTGLSGAGTGLLIGGGIMLGAGIPLIAFSGTSIEFLPLPSEGPTPLPAGTSEI